MTAKADSTPTSGHIPGGPHSPPTPDGPADGGSPLPRSRRVVALVSLSTLLVAALAGTLAFQKWDERHADTWHSATEHLYAATLDLNDALEAGETVLTASRGMVSEHLRNDLTDALNGAYELDLTRTYRLDRLIPAGSRQERIDAARALTAQARDRAAAVTSATLTVTQALTASPLAQTSTSQHRAPHERHLGGASVVEAGTRDPKHDRGRQDLSRQCLDDLQSDCGIDIVEDAKALSLTSGVIADDDSQGLEEIQGLAQSCLGDAGQFLKVAAHHRPVLFQVVEHCSAQGCRDCLQQSLLPRGQHCGNTAGSGHAPTVLALEGEKSTLTSNPVVPLLCRYTSIDSLKPLESTFYQPGGAAA